MQYVIQIAESKNSILNNIKKGKERKGKESNHSTHITHASLLF